MSSERLVLFLCVENACRSLMAESMFNASPPPGWRASSAGTVPTAGPIPRTGPMLHEIGMDLPAHGPRTVSSEMLDRATIRISMGCLDSDSCPARLRTLPVRDWALPDPARLDDAGFRAVRDQLRRLVAALVLELRSAPEPEARSRAS